MYEQPQDEIGQHKVFFLHYQLWQMEHFLIQQKHQNLQEL